MLLEVEKLESGYGASPVQARSGSSFSFWRPLAAEPALMDEARTIAADVDLSDRVDVPSANLSHGDQRALEVGLALATRARLLLLDEPMAGMGQEDVSVVSAIIRDVARDRAVLMVEHNLSVVANICQHVTVLQRGEILAEGDYAAVSQDERVRQAYMGTEEHH